MTTYVHSVIVIDKAATPLPSGLHVEVWDESGIVPDLLASGVTDADGRVELRMTEQDVDDRFADQEAMGYFKVWKPNPDAPLQGYLLADTQGVQSWDIRGPAKRTRILVDTDNTGDGELYVKFIVRGYITHADTGPMGGTTVTAEDMRASGDVVLGSSALTNDRGFYEIAYDRSELGNKQLADLKITASSGEVTRCQAPPTATINLTINGESYRPTEYASVLTAIAPALAGAALETLDDEQLEQVACSSRRSVEEVRTLAAARTINAGLIFPDAEVLYGLLRQGLPRTREDLFANTHDVLRAAIERAVDARQIAPLEEPNDLDWAMLKLRDGAVALAREAATGDATCNVEDLLVLAGLTTSPTDEVREFLRLYVVHQDTLEAFWTSTELTSLFSAPTIADIQLVLQLGALTRYHFPLIQYLWANKASWVDLRGLAAVDEATWFSNYIDEVTGSGAPVGIDEETEYPALLALSLESALPTAAIAGRVAVAAGQPSPPQVVTDLDTFFTNNRSNNDESDFDFTRHRVAAVWGDADLTGIDPANQPALQAELKAMARLFRVTKRHSEIQVLREAGIGSARAIARYGRSRFIADFSASNKLGNDKVAAQVYDKAKRHAAMTTQLWLMLQQTINGPHTTYSANYSTSNTPPNEPLVADWPSIFGTLSNCACTHCRSVLGPVAYLVDSLRLLGEFPSKLDDDGEPWTAQEALLGGVHGEDSIPGRRPDIGHTLLHCNNLRPVPYIDLLNEILEREVTGAAITDPIETTATPEELLAAPEYIDLEAYDDAHLGGAFYPWTLPYSLWHHQARVYVEHLGTPRHELMEEFQRPFRGTQIPGCRLVLDAALGLRHEAGKLAEWRDISGFDHSAAQPDPSARPAIGIEGDGQPYIELTAAESFIIGHRDTLDFGGPLTIAAVVSHVATGSAPLVTKGDSPFHYGLGLNSGAPQAFYTGSSQTGPAWDAAAGTEPTLCIAELSDMETRFRLDGVETVTGSGGSLTTGTNTEPLRIGGGFTGRVYMFMMFDAALTADELARLEGYVAERFHGGAAVVEPSALAIAQERLGMSKLAREVVTGSPPPASNPWERWGFDALDTNWDEDLLQVTTFLDRSGMTFDELRELLDTALLDAFAAPGDTPHIAPDLTLPEPDPCNIDHFIIDGLDATLLAGAWDAIQRFMRLVRVTGWSIRDTDVLLTAFGGALDNDLIEHLGDVAALLERFPRVSKPELASWWAALDVRPSLDQPSFYASLFLARTMVLPSPDPFALGIPLAAWQLDETSGAAAADAIGSLVGAHGNGVTVDQDGVVGRAALFMSGGGKTATDLGQNVFALDRDTPFSLCGWVKLSPSASDVTVVSSRDSSNGWLLRIKAGRKAYAHAVARHQRQPQRQRNRCVYC